jgi:hypothetical protein
MKRKSFTLFILLAVKLLVSQSLNYKWAKQFGGNTDVVSSAIIVDSSNSVFTIGIFRDSVDFDPGASTFFLKAPANTSALFISKLDSSGNFVWARKIDYISNSSGSSFTLDSATNIYITGPYSGTVDFDPGAGTYNLTATVSRSVFVLKLNSAGDFVWAKSLNSSTSNTFSSGFSIIAEGFRDIIISGVLQGSVDFNPGTGIYNLTATGFSSCFIVKLDTSGNFIWARKTGGNSSSAIWKSVVDMSGNIYSAGIFQDTMNVNTGSGTNNLISVNGSQDIFILKLDTSGNLIWGKKVGGGSLDNVQSFGLDTSSDVYLAGAFSGSCDFDPGSGAYTLTSVGGDDIFVLKLDSSGNFEWAKRMGSTGSDHGYSIHVENNGTTYSTGDFRNTVDFDPGIGTNNLTAAGFNDIFIVELDPWGNFVGVKRIGSRGNDWGKAITEDRFGSLYTTGGFDSIVEFDPGSGVANLNATVNAHIFVQKLSHCRVYTTQSATACDSFILNNQTYYTSGNYTQTIPLSSGCDSIVRLNLIIKQHTGSSITQTGCDSILINNIKYTTSGVYQQTFTNSVGCDSTISLTLTIQHSSSSTVNQAACDSFVWNGTTYHSSGAYNKHFTNSFGCDSSVVLVLTLKQSSFSITNLSSCDSVVWNGTSYYSSGTYNQHFTNTHNCDSNAILVLSIKHSSSSVTTITVCDSTTWNGNKYYNSGTYNKHFTNTQNCDSNAILLLTVWHSTSSSSINSACDSFIWNGSMYTNSGTYSKHFTNAQNCDSTAFLVLTINPSTFSTTAQTACDSIVWNGATFKNSGIYSKHFSNAQNCDSTAFLVLTINHPSVSTIMETACDSIVWNGSTYFTSGTYNKHFTNAQNCDSTAYLVLTINHPTSSATTVVSCDSFIWNGTTYHTSGTYSKHFTNSQNCDSLASLLLTILTHTSSVTTLSVCDSILWNGSMYYSSGTYYSYLKNKAGCDSIAGLDLTVEYATAWDTTISVCRGFTFNGTNYDTSGVYTYKLTNSKGCDSIVTVNLTINTVNDSVTKSGSILTAMVTGANYQWVWCTTYSILPGDTNRTYVATQSGNYAVIVSANGCKDTSDCFTVTIAGINQKTSSDILFIYPNPNNGEFTVRYGQPGAYVILNDLGKEIVTFRLDDSEMAKLDFSNLGSGVYLMKGPNISRKIFILK